MEKMRNKIAEIITQTYRTPLEQADEILLLLGVTNRTFKCNRCGTIYTLKDGDTVGCCVMPVEHRTSGICGGELIEVI